MRVRQEDWTRVATAVGDLNPLHYADANNAQHKPVCAGVYLLALAEQKLRDRGFAFPGSHMNISFSKPVYDGEQVNHIVDNGIRMVREGREIASFYGSSGILEIDFRGAREYALEITPNAVREFSDVLGISSDNPYYAFGFGAITNAFLNEPGHSQTRIGALMKNLQFCFGRVPRIGAGLVKLVTRELPKKRGIDYIIHAGFYQDGKRIVTGIANGFKFNPQPVPA